MNVHFNGIEEEIKNENTKHKIDKIILGESLEGNRKELSQVR